MNILEILGWPRRKTCRFCKRTLRGKNSVRAGYGPVCGAKNAAKIYQEDLERQGQMDFFKERKEHEKENLQNQNA